jgi:hypothetical protein
MDSWAERGLDRSTLQPTDPRAAFQVEGWFAGYAGSTLSNRWPPLSLQSRMWMVGYLKGADMRRRLQAGRGA